MPGQNGGFYLRNFRYNLRLINTMFIYFDLNQLLACWMVLLMTAMDTKYRQTIF